MQSQLDTLSEVVVSEIESHTATRLALCVASVVAAAWLCLLTVGWANQQEELAALRAAVEQYQQKGGE